MLIVYRGPSFAAVEANTGSAVVAFDHSTGVLGVDPQIMVIAMRGGHLLEILSAVDGLPSLIVEDPQGIAILRVSEDVLVIPGSSLDVLVVAHIFPVRSAVIGAK